MVYKIKVGNAFSSNAFQGEFKVLESHGRIEAKEVKNGYQVDISLAPEDRVFGLGESTGSMNKRGRVIVSFNSDNGRHEDDTYSLYSSHNFLLIDGARPLGIFFDSASRLIFDIGHGDKSLLSVKSDKGVDVYLIEGDDPLSITREFLSHLQTSYVPPLWGLGYGQSRFSYFSEKEVKRVARKYRRHKLPLDYICLDIHYMDKFEDFTFNPSRFPDPKGMGDSPDPESFLSESADRFSWPGDDSTVRRCKEVDASLMGFDRTSLRRYAVPDEVLGSAIWPRFARTVSGLCRTGYDDGDLACWSRYTGLIRKLEDQSGFLRPNLLYKPAGFEMEWGAKGVTDSPTMNRNLSYREIMLMLSLCLQSVSDNRVL